MKIRIYTVGYQIYLLPYLKITYDKWLNGDYELIIGWLKWQLVFSIGSDID